MKVLKGIFGAFVFVWLMLVLFPAHRIRNWFRVLVGKKPIDWKTGQEMR